MSAIPLILASSSPRRIDLLGQFGLPFQVIPSDAEELHDECFTAAELCSTNALRKAEQVARLHPNAVVLGADTLVTLRGRHFGKPRTPAQATEMLAELSGRVHQVITGVALLHLKENRRETFADETDVTFHALTAQTIQKYMALVPVLDKAGAYAIQDRGAMLVARIDGSFSNVIGLPVERLAGTLCAWGLISPPVRDKIVASQQSRHPGI